MNGQYVATQIVLLYGTYGYCITCYECSSGAGEDCLRTSVSCTYGLFGCMKATVYSGGIDKFGNYENQKDRVLGMYRGCTVLPLGSADLCQQSSLFGYRLVTCYCFNDFCNGAKNVQITSSITLLFLLLMFLLQ
ncbi:unnamed protein product [Gongylonema pulchrum]|uniref:Protein quiver n=1 Tax=Gongylonema pulchrum TaxID=637853 RepID=A0A183CX07_9BILA|nr:unnamed protein product [Gongylonema pulchrum]